MTSYQGHGFIHLLLNSNLKDARKLNRVELAIETRLSSEVRCWVIGGLKSQLRHFFKINLKRKKKERETKIASAYEPRNKRKLAHSI